LSVFIASALTDLAAWSLLSVTDAAQIGQSYGFFKQLPAVFEL